MSWFHPDNFSEFRDDSQRNEQPVILLQRNDNCFKELCKVFKKAMSWFSNFAAFNQDDLGNRNPTQNVISFPLYQHDQHDQHDQRNQIKPNKPKIIEVSESERDYIKEKYQIPSNLIENFTKIKNEHTKLENYKKEFDENVKKIKISSEKIQALIETTDDQELTEILTKRIKSNPLHQKNQELEILIGELEKELTLEKGFEFKKNICGICFESEVNCFNKNCGHSFCETCMKKTTKCASCRIKIYRGDICKIF
jgi:hypothetical protein